MPRLMTSETEFKRTALTNVRVFDGHRVGDPGTVVIDGAVIGTDPARSARVDGEGGVLLPGLIDAHVHLHGVETLHTLAAAGVTTALDMGTWPPSLVASLRELPGLTDIRSPGIPAIGPAGAHARIPSLAANGVIDSADDATSFVAARATEGADYIKVVLEAPGAGGPPGPAVDALVAAARERGLRVIAHAAAPEAWTLALDARVDVITHVPLGAPLDPDVVARAVAGRQVAVPTLTMMEGIAAGIGRPGAFSGAVVSVSTLRRAGVPVLAGTDANDQPGVPFNVPHGESLHHELELLVSAGLTCAEALNAATSAPARFFNLRDRGAVAPGLRADLVLVDGDPVADISASRRVRRVWCAGVEVAQA